MWNFSLSSISPPRSDDLSQTPGLHSRTNNFGTFSFFQENSIFLFESFKQRSSLKNIYYAYCNTVLPYIIQSSFCVKACAHAKELALKSSVGATGREFIQIA